MEDIYKQTTNLTDKIVALDFAEIAMCIFLDIGKPEYSVEELTIVEEKICKEFPETDNKFHSMMIPLGWYFAKCILKNIEDSYWVGDGKDPRNLIIEVPCKKMESTGAIYPFNRVINFWKKDRTDGLAPFIWMVQFLNEFGIPDPAEADENGWIEKGGFKMRVKSKLDLYE